MIMLWIGLGGAIGSILRYLISQALQGSTGLFPIGTMTVNVIGSLILGALFAMHWIMWWIHHIFNIRS